MSEVVICDTNAAIHLAIICPDVLESPKPECKIVIHSLVKTEIHKLNQNAEKNKRLGPILEFILKKVPTETRVALPNQHKEIVEHKRIQLFESTLDPELISSGSSHSDRCFLILAKFNKAKLLTNERTLYNLGLAFLPDDQAWRTSDAISKLLELDLVTKGVIQSGLNNMIVCEEFLNFSCAEKIRKLGFRYS